MVAYVHMIQTTTMDWILNEGNTSWLFVKIDIGSF
jgi:hypothetical protein